MSSCQANLLSQESSIAPQTNPSWRRVPLLVDLAQIYDLDLQICSWQREIDPAIEVYLRQIRQEGELQFIESLNPKTCPKLDRLPSLPGKASLIEDLSLLKDIVFELLGCDEVGLRLARIRHAMCPGWHVDRVSVRLVCTCQGPGTQWLDNQQVDRDNVHSLSIEKKFEQSAVGEIVLLKGAGWQGNEDFGAIHRSPELNSNELRTVITFDPLWYE